MKKEKIINEKMEEGTPFIKVPQKKSGIFNLKPAAFKLYTWLSSHENGYSFTNYFISKGTNMDYRTIKKALIELENNGMVTISNSTIRINTISKSTISNNVDTISNSAEKLSKLTNEEEKEEEKKEENVIDKKVGEKIPEFTNFEERLRNGTWKPTNPNWYF